MLNPRVVIQRLFQLTKSSGELYVAACRTRHSWLLVNKSRENRVRACIKTAFARDLVRSNLSLGMTDRDEFTSRRGSIRPRFLRTKDLRTWSCPTCPFIDRPMPDTKSYRAFSLPSLELDKIPRKLGYIIRGEIESHQSVPGDDSFRMWDLEIVNNHAGRFLTSRDPSNR